MVAHGLTATGFLAKTTDEILEEIVASQRADIASDLDTSAESVIGMLNAIFATKTRELWELAGIIYNARVPANATFATLDALAAITGTTRRAATQGTVTLEVQLTAGTTLTAGNIAHVDGDPDNRWQTIEAATNPSGFTDWIEVRAQAMTAGRYVANSMSIQTIATPSAGWLAVRNPLDAVEGRGIETDSELRVRRDIELSSADNATLDAIRTRLLAVANAAGELMIDGCVVDENASAYTDALGRDPHAIECVLQLSAAHAADTVAGNALIAATLWAAKPAGNDYWGTTELDVIDSNGEARVVRYNTPTDVDIWINVSIEVDEANYVGTTALKTALVEYGDALLLGADVVRAKLYALIVDTVGVEDLFALTIGITATSLDEDNIRIGPRERAVFDTARITVVTS